MRVSLYVSGIGTVAGAVAATVTSSGVILNSCEVMVKNEPYYKSLIITVGSTHN